MVVIESSIEILRPVDIVFNYCMDVKTWPRWMGDEVETEQTSDEKITVGVTFRGSIKGLGPQWVWIGKFTEYEPNSRCGCIIDSTKCQVEAYAGFVSMGDGTMLSLTYNFQGFGYLRFLAPLFKGAMVKRTGQSLSRMKTILES
jgi:hypothetical protein